MGQANTDKAISSPLKWTVVLLMIAFLINTLWLNIVYRHELFLMSLNFIIDYQRVGNKFTEVVYNIFSLISGT